MKLPQQAGADEQEIDQSSSPNPGRSRRYRLKNANVSSSLAIEPPLAEIRFM
jgi:hypothetical protein